MAVSRAMRRLLEVREIEEGLSRAALESAMGDLKRLETALKATREKERSGRRLVAASAETDELADRIAGLEEICAAQRHVTALSPRITETKLTVAARRREFLAKRIERRQAETLIRKIESGDAIEAGRRAQRGVDDWFLRRARRSSCGDHENLNEATAQIGYRKRREIRDRS
jgi:flagellar biosynthesis chaperone FliJ